MIILQQHTVVILDSDWLPCPLQDALVNLIRRARPVFLQCVSAKSDGGNFDVPALRVQLHAAQILSALQLYRTGERDEKTLTLSKKLETCLSP